MSHHWFRLWYKKKQHLVIGMEGTLTLCSYGKFGRFLLEIAPVSITETCLQKGVQKETNGKVGVSMDRGKREGLHQMDC